MVAGTTILMFYQDVTPPFGRLPWRSPLRGNEKIFNNLPGYSNVIVNRGQVATGDRQYFLVRPTNTGRNLKWYARCGNNSDQVYDHTGKYVGSDRRMTVMFSYVCEVSPLRPRSPIRPPIQPR